jgi:hypothetical protein
LCVFSAQKYFLLINQKRKQITLAKKNTPRKKNQNMQISANSVEPRRPIPVSLPEDFSKHTIFEGRAMEEHVSLPKIRGFIKRNQGITFRGIKRYEEQAKYFKTEIDMMREYSTHWDKEKECITTNYFLPKHGWGRIICPRSMTQSLIHRPTRHSLCKGGYVDLDLKNCHPQIQSQILLTQNYMFPRLTEYGPNSERLRLEIAEHHGCDEEAAKMLPLRLMYGGGYQAWITEYKPRNAAMMPFWVEFREEIDKIMAIILKENAHITAEVVADKEERETVKQWNTIAEKARGTLSMWCCTIERALQEHAIEFLRIKFDAELEAFVIPCQDGFLLKEEYYYEGIEADLREEQRLQFGLDISWEKKELKKAFFIEDSFEEVDYSEYGTRKMEFERNNFYVGSEFIHIQTDGTIEHVKIPEMKTRMRCNNFMKVINAKKNIKNKVYFFEEWLDDPTRAKYDKIDFIPDRSKCPDYVFNLFKGFAAEKHRPDIDMTKDEIDAAVVPIKYHAHLLTSGYEDSLFIWMATIIQNPTRKTELAIVIRDLCSLLQNGGGTGKNYFIEKFFGMLVLGDDLIYDVQDNRELYGPFNSQFEAKLLIIVEEAQSKENHSNHDLLKAKITTKKQNINRKCVAGYQVQDHSNFIFFTNNRNALPIKKGNRKMMVFDTMNCKRGDVNYFKTLIAHLEKPSTIWAFFQYLKGLKIYASPIEMQVNIPRTKGYVELMRTNAEIHMKWLADRVENGTLPTQEGTTISDLYRDYCTYIEENVGECKQDQKLSLKAFSIRMCSDTAEQGITIQDAEGNLLSSHKSTGGTMRIVWNLKLVRKCLVELCLLDELEPEKPKKPEETEEPPKKIQRVEQPCEQTPELEQEVVQIEQHEMEVITEEEEDETEEDDADEDETEEDETEEDDAEEDETEEDETEEEMEEIEEADDEESEEMESDEEEVEDGTVQYNETTRCDMNIGFSANQFDSGSFAHLNTRRIMNEHGVYQQKSDGLYYFVKARSARFLRDGESFYVKKVVDPNICIVKMD